MVLNRHPQVRSFCLPVLMEETDDYSFTGVIYLKVPDIKRPDTHSYVRCTYFRSFYQGQALLCWSQWKRDTQKWGTKILYTGYHSALSPLRGKLSWTFFTPWPNAMMGLSLILGYEWSSLQRDTLYYLEVNEERSGACKIFNSISGKKYSDWNWELIDIFIWVYVVEINSHWILILEGNCLMTQFDPEYFKFDFWPTFVYIITFTRV